MNGWRAVVRRLRVVGDGYGCGVGEMDDGLSGMGGEGRVMDVSGVLGGGSG